MFSQIFQTFPNFLSIARHSPKFPPFVQKEGIDNRRLRIHVEQRMDKNFVIPDCDAKCIKKAVFGHFMDKVEFKMAMIYNNI